MTPNLKRSIFFETFKKKLYTTDQVQMNGIMWRSPKFLACKVDKREPSQRLLREKNNDSLQWSMRGSWTLISGK